MYDDKVWKIKEIVFYDEEYWGSNFFVVESDLNFDCVISFEMLVNGEIFVSVSEVNDIVFVRM